MDVQQQYDRAVNRIREGNVSPDQVASLMLSFIDLDNSFVRSPVERIRQWREFLAILGCLGIRLAPLRVVKD